MGHDRAGPVPIRKLANGNLVNDSNSVQFRAREARPSEKRQFDCVDCGAPHFGERQPFFCAPCAAKRYPKTVAPKPSKSIK